MKWHKIAKEWKKLDKQLSELCNRKVYIVDGNYVRNHIDVYYELGAHYLVMDYIPKEEIWLEDLKETEDMLFNLIHERYEIYLMEKNKMEYDDAHEKTMELEKKARRKYCGSNISEILEFIGVINNIISKD